jgi:enterochelin esterase-like enzyme
MNAPAQPPPPDGPRPPAVTSPAVKEKKVTFRILAPKAEKVGLAGTDIPGGPKGGAPRPLTKGENGVWEVTLDPVAPGTYRYLFDVDGVRVLDPRNTATSESNGNVWSLVRVPGASFMDTADVPHGAVSRITYKSGTVGKNRRAHVYTPPGYETSTEKYPVLYLLHGAGDCDDSWTSVGRAHDILDNLIAAKKAKPMVVVMPAGHTGPFAFGSPSTGGQPPPRFEDDFEKDLRPYIEKTYRVRTDRADRAIAGLSMGGGQTLNIFATKPTDYGYVGVFSSGVFARGDEWEKVNRDRLSGKEVKDGLKVLWFATGKEDFLLERTKETVALLEKFGLKPEFKETGGGHTWINWQEYFNEFAPKLFR